jgi:hypothetical protein
MTEIAPPAICIPPPPPPPPLSDGPGFTRLCQVVQRTLLPSPTSSAALRCRAYLGWEDPLLRSIEEGLSAAAAGAGGTVCLAAATWRSAAASPSDPPSPSSNLQEAKSSNSIHSSEEVLTHMPGQPLSDWLSEAHRRWPLDLVALSVRSPPFQPAAAPKTFELVALFQTLERLAGKAGGCRLLLIKGPPGSNGLREGLLEALLRGQSMARRGIAPPSLNTHCHFSFLSFA